MSLPTPWVEKIFHKLTLTYGRDFVSKWEGLDMEEVKADWAHELRGLQQNPASIAYGLEHCIAGKPPTVHEFKAACVRRIETNLALPGPVADPAFVASVIAKIAKPSGHDMKAWARILKTRHDAGEKLSRYQIHCYQTALGAA